MEELSKAVSAKKTGQYTDCRVGKEFLKAVDVTTQSVPHTNEATKRARHDGQAFIHEFGHAHYFLTVTPDDDNHILVQILSGIKIDDEKDVSLMTDKELADCAKQHTEL